MQTWWGPDFGGLEAAELEVIAALITACATIVLAAVAVAQIKATRRSAEATVEAARAQMQPLVYANKTGEPIVQEGGELLYRYYLTNEGLGPALNVSHGVDLVGSDGRKRLVFGGGEESMQFRALKAEERVPPPTHLPLGVSTTADALPPLGDQKPTIYWARYENLWGDAWETQNSDDPTAEPTIRQLEKAT